MIRLGRSQVEEIRKRYAEGKDTQLQIARDYGVSQTQISSIVRYARLKDQKTHPVFGGSIRWRIDLETGEIIAIRDGE